MGSFGAPELFAVIVVGGIFCVLPIYKILCKAGFPWRFSLLMSLTILMPFVNLVLLFFLAFSEWPVLKELKALRQKTVA